jgi:asparagine synthetase B (glutamine-hydrolysing)
LLNQGRQKAAREKIMKVKIKRLHGKNHEREKKAANKKKLALRAPFLDRKIGRDRLSLGPKKWPTGGLVRGSAAISSLGIVGLGTGFF